MKLLKFTIASLLFMLTHSSFSQEKKVKSFMFDDTKIEYSRIDYSKYGVTQFFITMYNKSPDNNLIVKKSSNCLRNKERLYHTLYFFLEIPGSLENELEKTNLFSEFVSYLKLEEKLESFDLYLNFDINYSIQYQLSENNVKRVTTNISKDKICRNLTIR